MSWDSYIDNVIAHSKDAGGQAHVDKACIIGLDAGASWTSAEYPNALKFTPTEGASVAKAFKSRDFTPFMTSGIFGEGVKYQFLREEDGKTVLAKKKGCGALTLVSSKTAVVVGHCPEGGQQGNANKAVARIAEYLEGVGM